jgi:general secretion pathway protein H
MTLIEISIALLIVGLLVFVALPSVEAVVGVRAREEAGKLSGAIRYMYGNSALTGKVCRIAFDLDERSYWPECTQGRFTVDREKERASGGRRADEEREERQREARDDFEALKNRIEKRAEFAAFTGGDAKKRSLPSGANLAVWTGHQREKYTKGKAYLYFFPQGHTERARIYVTSDHGDVYTLTVSPLNGKVKVVDKELEIPRD